MMTIINSTVLYIQLHHSEPKTTIPVYEVQFGFVLTPPGLSETVADQHGYTMAILSSREPEEKHDAGGVADMFGFLARLGSKSPLYVRDSIQPQSHKGSFSRSISRFLCQELRSNRCKCK